MLTHVVKTSIAESLHACPSACKANAGPNTRANSYYQNPTNKPSGLQDLFSLSLLLCFPNSNRLHKPLIPNCSLGFKEFLSLFPFNQCNQRKPQAMLTLRYQKLSSRSMTGWIECVQPKMQTNAWESLVPRWLPQACFVSQLSQHTTGCLTHTIGVLDFLKILTVLDPFTCMITGNKWYWSLSSGQTLALPGLNGTVLTLSWPVSICKYRHTSHWPHLYQRGNVKDKQNSTFQRYTVEHTTLWNSGFLGNCLSHWLIHAVIFMAPEGIWVWEPCLQLAPENLAQWAAHMETWQRFIH